MIFKIILLLEWVYYRLVPIVTKSGSDDGIQNYLQQLWNRIGALIVLHTFPKAVQVFAPGGHNLLLLSWW